MTDFLWKWPAESIDAGRLERAIKVKTAHLEISDNVCHGTFIGSKGYMYTATLASCDCPDYSLNHGRIPCKHILRLAIEAGIIEKNGKTPEQQKKADINSMRLTLAVAYGMYYLFDDPYISDSEYDQLKQNLIDMGELKTADEQIPNRESATDYLKNNNVEYIDKTLSGGGLYFFDEHVADELKAMGYNVRYAQNGTRSTVGKAAYYIKFK